MRQNGGSCDRQKADIIFTGAAGSRISERGAVPLWGTVAGAVGNFRIRGAVRFSDDLQLLRPPAHSTGSAVCHGLFLSKNTQVVSAAPYYDGCCPALCAEGASGAALCPWSAVLCCAAQLVVSIFLLQTWIPSSRFWFCLNGVAWYLSVQAFLYAIFPWLLAVLKKADARRLRCIAAAIFCAQCLFSLVIWKAGLSGNAVFYLTYLCPLFRAGDFAISCCMGCLYRSRKEERTPYGACSLLELAAVLFSGGCFFIAAGQVGVLGATAFRYNVLFTPSAVLLVWLLAIGKGMISRLLSAKPFLWLAGLSPYGFLIHQVLIRYMDLAANKFGLTVHPVVWTLTVFLLTLCLSSFCRALERRVGRRHAKSAAQ